MITKVKVGAGPCLVSPFLCLGLGSCFISHLEDSLSSWNIPYKFNPLGTSFNPVSISEQLNWLLDDQYSLEPIELYNSSVHHLAAGNKFQANSKELLFSQINEQRQLFSSFLNTSQQDVTLVFSFGTAHAWERNGRIVNNCHKLPGDFFIRRILTQEEIIEAWKKVINKIPEHWNIIFTVSPVRYTKIGLIDNFLGKSILRLAIEKLLTLRKNSFYFPSYEIITDELRDYSFSEDNGTHPNQKAVAVVMDRFKEFLFI